MADARRRPGPKPRGPFENKRLTLTTRITEDLRKKLEAAAEATGRSLSQEIELRLLESFTAAERLASIEQFAAETMQFSRETRAANERMAASADRAMTAAEQAFNRGERMEQNALALLAKVQELL